MDSNLLRTKSIEQLVGDAEHGGKALRRTLTAMDLTLLGIGAIIGTGIFVLTGTAAANQAGPGIVLSYVLAGLACGFAALCYAEFASMIPISGSAYTYAYATLGEIFAWMIGWDLILEYAVGSMTVAVGWSGYFQRILAGLRDSPAGLDVGFAESGDRVAHQPAGRAHRARDHGAARHRRPRERALQRGDGRDQARRRRVLHRHGRHATCKPANWSPSCPYGVLRRRRRGRPSSFSRTSASTRSRRRPRRRRTPAATCRSASSRRSSSARCSTSLWRRILSGMIPVTHYRSAVEGLPGTPIVPPAEATAFLNAPVGIRAARHQQGLGRGAGLGRRGRGDHERAARHAHEPAADLLRHEPRPSAAGGRQQGAPEVPDAVHHDDDHLRGRGDRRRVRPDQPPRRDDQHRHAVRVRGGVAGRHHPSREAAGSARGPSSCRSASSSRSAACCSAGT